MTKQPDATPDSAGVAAKDARKALHGAAARLSADLPLSRGVIEAELDQLEADGIRLPTEENIRSLATIAMDMGAKAGDWPKMWRKSQAPGVLVPPNPARHLSAGAAKMLDPEADPEAPTAEDPPLNLD